MCTGLWARLVLTWAVALAAVAFAAAASEPAVASDQAGAVIRDIKVTGNNRIEPETVKPHLKLAKGDRYDTHKADESLKSLYATGLFKDVNINLRGSTLVVSVTENPLIARVAFEGNKDIKPELLTKVVQTKTNGTYSRAKVEADVQRILDLYRRQGYYTVQVDPKMIEKDHGRVDVVFEIKEGPETKVMAINFIGNASFSDAELRGVISTSQSGLLDFLKPTAFYDPDRLNYDRELLRRFYVKNGFADMRVVSAIADTDRDGKGFFVTFTVNEGPRYTFGALDLDVTVRELNAEAFRLKVLGQPGDIYNSELIDKTVEALTATAAEKGQPFAQVRGKIDRDPIRRTISVVYVIEQGVRVYIDRINIVGNTVTLDPVIRREFRIAEGDPYSRVMVEAARQRLLKLGYFKDVKVTKEPGPSPDRVNLTVTVQEQQTGELSFAAGYSTTQGIIGEVNYTERNLMGTGQYLTVKLSGSMSGDGAFTVSWMEPHFLDSNFSLGADAFVKNSDYTASSGYVVAGYEDFRVGGSLRLGTALTDSLSVSTNYTLMWEDVYNLDPTASLAVKQIAGTAIVSSVGYSLIFDTRNNKKKPTLRVLFQRHPGSCRRGRRCRLHPLPGRRPGVLPTYRRHHACRPRHGRHHRGLEWPKCPCRGRLLSGRRNDPRFRAGRAWSARCRDRGRAWRHNLLLGHI